MDTSSEEIRVVCPACGTTYAAWDRPAAAETPGATATCPACGHAVAIASLAPRWDDDEDEEVYVQESPAEG